MPRWKRAIKLAVFRGRSMVYVGPHMSCILDGKDAHATVATEIGAEIRSIGWSENLRLRLSRRLDPTSVRKQRIQSSRSTKVSVFSPINPAVSRSRTKPVFSGESISTFSKPFSFSRAGYRSR